MSNEQDLKDRRDAEEFANGCGSFQGPTWRAWRDAFLGGRQSCPCRTSSSKSPETLTSSPASKAPSDLERALDEALAALECVYEKVKSLPWKGGAAGPSWITLPRDAIYTLRALKKGKPNG